MLSTSDTRWSNRFLEAIINRSNAYRPVQAAFFSAISKSNATRVTDLCSGGGGPWLSPTWKSAVTHRRPLTVVLTDKFPSSALSARLQTDSVLRDVNDPVDATSVPADLRGSGRFFPRFTIFSTHWRALLLKMRSRAEMASPWQRCNWRALAFIGFLPFVVWLLTTTIRPWRWSRLLLTYFVPLIPLVVLWDGWVSCFRTRTPKELLRLTTPSRNTAGRRATRAAQDSGWTRST